LRTDKPGSGVGLGRPMGTRRRAGRTPRVRFSTGRFYPGGESLPGEALPGSAASQCCGCLHTDRNPSLGSGADARHARMSWLPCSLARVGFGGGW
jgi:hypothetical protein